MTAVEYLEYMWTLQGAIYKKDIDKALEIQIAQMLKVSNVSAKEAYKAGQKTMYCGCYDIEDATTFEQWVLQKHELNKSE